MIRNPILKILFIVYLIIPIQSFGQTNDSTKQWELGFDLLWLIDKQPLSDPNIFVRINNPQKNKAWRLRLGGRFSYLETPTNSISRDDHFTDIRSFITLGREWQKEITQDASFYYGMDLGTRYNRRSWEISSSSTTSFIKEIDRNFEVIPFVGFKYKFTDWLAASLESAMLLSYGSSLQTREVSENTSSNVVDTSRINSNNVSASFLPFSIINLSFYIP